MSTNPTPLKDVIKQEYVKCAKDPAYFMKKFCMIQHPIKGKIPFDLYNIGSDKPEYLKNFVKLIENNLLKKAKVRYKSLQLGDVVKTHASIAKLKKATGYKPSISVKVGIKKFTDWYLSYYK